MKINKLTEIIRNPEIHRLILGDYQDSYSIAVTNSSNESSNGAILLRVQSEDVSKFPQNIRVNGENIQIIVKGKMRALHAA